MTRLLSLLLASGAIAVAGCGSSIKHASSSTSTAPPAAAASSGTVTVDMKNIDFSPRSITVKRGQTIRWVNQDTVQHNVTATRGATFKSENFADGKSYTFKTDAVGTIRYVCTIHPGMNGAVIVR